MTEREIDIADMQCWVFRIAQTRWHISPIECAELFKKYDILGYISECYDLLCTYSYYHVVDDAEAILAGHNVLVNDIDHQNTPSLTANRMERSVSINCLWSASSRCSYK